METIEIKSYELRELQSKDLFPMFGILNKIGFNEIKSVFESESVKNLMGTSGAKELDINAVGITVTFEIASVVLSNLPKCQKEIYDFLSGLSGLKVAELETMGIAVFAQVIIDVIKKEEFKDFFKVVSKLFK